VVCVAWVLWTSAKVILYCFFTDYEKTKGLLERTGVRLQLRKASLCHPINRLTMQNFAAPFDLVAIFCRIH
jgi:hypothetical protein